MSKSPNLLITGATGFLGSYLVPALLEEGYRVAILKRPQSSLERLAPSLSRLTIYDLDETTLETMLADQPFDIVLHLATNYGRLGESEASLVEANVVFPLHLMTLAARAGVPFFVNTDTTLDRVTSDYSLSKKQFTDWGQAFANCKKIHFINISLQYMYGAYDDIAKFPTYVIRTCIANKHSLGLSPGEQQRDFIYIEDVIAAFKAIIARLTTPEADQCYYQEFQVGTGEATSLRDFSETVKRLTTASTELCFGAVPYRDKETMFSQADITALRQLGWSPQNTLEQGLAKTIEKEKSAYSHA